jgi:hypothetical protein
MFLTQLHEKMQMHGKIRTISDCINMQTVVQDTNSELFNYPPVRKRLTSVTCLNNYCGLELSCLRICSSLAVELMYFSRLNNSTFLNSMG